MPPGDLWVFGYGSLMWNPGFDHAARARATVHGCHRALCVWSWVHRGTPNAPGLVLGLDRGGSCTGVAFRVPGARRHATIEYLYARELVTDVYLPAVRAAAVAGVGVVRALTFVVDRDHLQYAGRLAPRHAAAVVRRASGRGGANIDYVTSTLACLDALDIRCTQLARVRAALTEP
ncbi:MAG: gamma-glutamylcyclotransferase [Gammaproteobacteria bacterium]|nr:gamma-glutamylcyclotransferase [Gammaproteobacteria bacterium]